MLTITGASSAGKYVHCSLEVDNPEEGMVNWKGTKTPSEIFNDVNKSLVSPLYSSPTMYR